MAQMIMIAVKIRISHVIFVQCGTNLTFNLLLKRVARIATKAVPFPRSCHLKRKGDPKESPFQRIPAVGAVSREAASLHPDGSAVQPLPPSGPSRLV